MNSRNPEAPKQKKSFIHPDAVRTTFESAIVEQEKLDTRREKLEQAKQVLEDEKLDTKAVDERLGELKKIESPLKAFPEWTKSTGWIEHNEKAKPALEKAIAVMKDVPGEEARLQALQQRLDKINKLFYGPKQALHGLSHVDYARKVKKVLDSMELEGEGSEAKIDAQIEELQAELNIYNEMYKRAANDRTYLQFFQKKSQELYQRRDYLYKMIEKHESLHKEEKNLKNIKRLLAQIELNITDINNKRDALSDYTMMYEHLIPSNMRDSFNKLKKAYEALSHHQILIKSGVVKESASKDLLKKLEDAFKECEETVKKELEEHITKASKHEIPQFGQEPDSKKDLEDLRQLSYVKFFKEWILEISKKLEKDLKKAGKETSEPLTTREIQAAQPGRDRHVSLEQLVKEHRQPGHNLQKLIETTQKTLDAIKDLQKAFEEELIKLQEQEEISNKGVFGKEKRKREFDAYAEQINRKYQRAQHGIHFYSYLSYASPEHVKKELKDAIERAKTSLESEEQRLAAYKKLKSYIEAEEIKEQLKFLAELQEKLETK